MSASPVAFEGPDSSSTRKRKPPAASHPRLGAPGLARASLVLAGGGLGA